MTSPGYRLFDDLSPSEAKALLDAYVAGLPHRIDAFVDEVRRAGGPADRLDFERASMRPIWEWFVTAHRLPGVPVSDEAMRIAGPPWWYDFHPPLGQQLGPDLSRLVTNLAAYLAQSVIRHHPDASWVLGRDPRMADHNMPLLHIPGRGQSTVDDNLISLAIQALKGAPDQADLGRLERLFDWWVGDVAPAVTSTARPFSVGAIEGKALVGFTHVITFDDVVAHEQEDRVEALVGRLAGETGVESAVQDDREIVLVRAPQLETTDLEARVAQAWDAAGSTG